jgi:hypothetical protein
VPSAPPAAPPPVELCWPTGRAAAASSDAAQPSAALCSAATEFRVAAKNISSLDAKAVGVDGVEAALQILETTGRNLAAAAKGDFEPEVDELATALGSLQSTITSLTDQSSLSAKLGAALAASVGAVEQAAPPIVDSARGLSLNASRGVADTFLTTTPQGSEAVTTAREGLNRASLDRRPTRSRLPHRRSRRQRPSLCLLPRPDPAALTRVPWAFSTARKRDVHGVMACSPVPGDGQHSGPYLAWRGRCVAVSRMEDDGGG